MRIHGFTVKAKYVDMTTGFPNEPNDKMEHNKFRITLVKDGIIRRFPFYGSNHDWAKGKKELDANDLKNAFASILDDALAGRESFENFCSEFGYDTDSRRGYAIWKACRNTDVRVYAFGLEDDELIDLVNALRA